MENLNELYEVLHDSRKDDAIILDEIAARERERRLRRVRIAGVAAILALLVLFMAGASFLSSDHAAPQRSKFASMDIGEVDAFIRARTVPFQENRSGEDFRTLSQAYGRRFALTGSQSDLDAQSSAAQKAEVLETKLIKEGSMRNPAVFAAILVILVLAVLSGTLVVMYNGLARSDENVDNRWSQIQTVLQRRLDLIPNLIDAVKGYAQHEQETFAKVTEARSRMQTALEGTGSNAPRSAAAAALVDKTNNELGAALSKLMAVVENYPDLKASSNFIAFQDQLEGTENRISVERQRYNDVVRAYNSSLRTFPSNLVGRMFGFSARSYFEADSEAQKSPKSNFSK